MFAYPRHTRHTPSGMVEVNPVNFGDFSGLVEINSGINQSMALYCERELRLVNFLG
jgi:hypothetical protein